MTNIWYSSFVLYVGDTMMVAALVGGVLATVAATIRHSHRFIVLDVDQHMIKKFCYFQIAWLASALVLFKFIVLQGGPNFTHLIATGNHGSVQFSTAGELVAFTLMAYGIYRWCRWRSTPPTHQGGVVTTTTYLFTSPINQIQSTGDAFAPAFAAMATGLILLPIVGVSIRRVFNAISNRH